MRASPEQYVPQFVTDSRPRVLWLVLVFVTLVFVASIPTAPLALAGGHIFLGLTIYSAFSHLCHQLPERSFFIAGYKFAVCARCTGLYLGFAATALLYPLFRSLRRTGTPERKWLFLAATPLAIDFGLGSLNIWSNTHWSRFSTGALLGAVAVFYIIPGLVELSLTRRSSLFGAGKNRSRPSANSPNISPERLASGPSDYSAPHRRI